MLALCFCSLVHNAPREKDQRELEQLPAAISVYLPTPQSLCGNTGLHVGKLVGTLNSHPENPSGAQL